MGIATYPTLLAVLLYTASLFIPSLATRAPADADAGVCATCATDPEAAAGAAPGLAFDADLGRDWWQIRMALHVVDPLQAAARYEAVAEALGFRIGFAHDGARDATRFEIDPPRLSLPALLGLFRV
jgi:hypothetical protein